MNIQLNRVSEINDATLGELFINNKFFCYTLEDKIRDAKVQDRTCIPIGTYEVLLTMSARFKAILPILLNVPNFTGIRIHAGNTIEDTRGCILVGSSIQEDKLLHSKVALAKLLPVLKTALKTEKVFITVNPIKIKPVEVEIPPVVEQPVEPTKIVLPNESTISQTLITLLQWVISLFYKKL